ncbi:hypothetical protein Tco_0993168 [Tanacetum coccineum]|uniref:Uncharacterized protein n=1 Tax=Tanacetum coccineum TaxID=301880 RepID=A0ABQ5F597_9ASTR
MEGGKIRVGEKGRREHMKEIGGDRSRREKERRGEGCLLGDRREIIRRRRRRYGGRLWRVVGEEIVGSRAGEDEEGEEKEKGRSIGEVGDGLRGRCRRLGDA